MKGRAYREDKSRPVADAVIVLLDEKKSDQKDNSVESKTDAQGNFVFEKVVEGKYTVSIRTWHKSQEEAPCQLLMAKTRDKNSTVIIGRDKDKFVEQIFIKGFSVKAGKENLKDFDIACKGMFG
ncbi:MAG TPA: carboxypeptidase-like regulatory domain-containing protein [Pyrinomonadaceae bacterium]|nr:carboxypeptidase-like regulatory domain-containing protein [Pyrinomonadaceae bacterium]